MSDPFEIRLQFTKMLQRLNASVNASKNCAAFALKHKDLDEDLHSCILEQLETSSMNNRVNLLYFIEHLLEMSVAKSITNYIPMIQSEFRTIVDCVSPADQSGLQNIASTRKVLTKIKDAKLLPTDTYDTLIHSLNERERAGQHAHRLEEEGESDKADSEELEEVDQVPNGVTTATTATTTTTTVVGKDPEYNSDSARRSPSAPTAAAPTAAAMPYSPSAVNVTVDASSLGSTPTPTPAEPRRPPTTSQTTTFKRPPKQVIEERMEEDRERHKRLRETIWAIYPARDDDLLDRALDGLEAFVGPEFEMFWGDATEAEINDDDMELMAEEAELKAESLSVQAKWIQHVNTPLNQVFESLQQYGLPLIQSADFQSLNLSKRTSLIPDCVFVKSTRIGDAASIAVGEIKPWWRLNISEIFSNTGPTGEPTMGNKLDLEGLIGRLASYMWQSSTRYGFLATYENVIFVQRVDDYRYNISSPVHMEQSSPSLREAMFFFLFKSYINGWSYDSSHLQMNRVLIGDPVGERVSSRAAKGSLATFDPSATMGSLSLQGNNPPLRSGAHQDERTERSERLDTQKASGLSSQSMFDISQITPNSVIIRTQQGTAVLECGKELGKKTREAIWGGKQVILKFWDPDDPEYGAWRDWAAYELKTAKLSVIDWEFFTTREWSQLEEGEELTSPENFEIRDIMRGLD
ncbi:hypothetical protein Dda_1739 [Drechslerella dactyloides]|uniref:CID domain-containing protein n=1 Tax=Drechslerella dactyloides TaxID=74499 RepID=A0AAD6J2G4_DREDA|nr:hypothetical protein Dda_1739 [Drechslerella dactyloides]